MAHLEVEPKPSRPWWVWLLIALLLIALAALLFKKCSSETGGTRSDSISSDSVETIAATVPDWNSVDFNSAKIQDQYITDRDIAVSGNGTYTIYTLGENILFPTNGETISDAGKKKLGQISDALKKRFEGAQVAVFGSTDSTGPADENKELGRLRAEAVKAWLSSEGNIPNGRISVQSLGETEPVATNQTPAGRKQNRNVSIVVFNEDNK
ncbi:OmpA family protein [Pedobacter chinensis]|uniref:OmpA family protein n=1 Tax=Pedobacter chinensis TaxID=2282421 RepID=A0A369Q697_9SPHI|nr:OmpA family protein [Pedobacter chinensis]RDC58449.1 OmpA family protein [Pedobacter chinensis]